MQQELIINAGAGQTKKVHEPDVLERVQKLLPAIRERGESADQKRRLAEETARHVSA